MDNVFISYSRRDAAIVHPLVALIRCAGVGVFLDVDGIEYGDNWKHSISEAISNCKRFILVWSVSASESEWVNREYMEAKTKEKLIVPIILDGTPLPGDMEDIQACSDLVPLINAFQTSIGKSNISPRELYAREIQAAREDTFKAYPSSVRQIPVESQSIREKLRRIRKPRVYMNYEVSGDGSILTHDVDTASLEIAQTAVKRIFSSPGEQAARSIDH
jgi:hypothetical protein